MVSFGLLIVGLTIIYVVLSLMELTTWAPVAWALVGLTGAAAVCYGAIRNDPSSKLPWFFIAGGMLFLIVGDTYYNVLHYIFEHENAFPSISDAIYLMVYVCITAGFLMLAKKQLAGRRTDRLVPETLIVATGLALITWIYLIAPTSSSELSTFAKGVAFLYPVGDLLIWSLIVCNLFLRPQSRPTQLLLFGGALVVGADIMYSIAQLNSNFVVGDWIIFLWVGFYLLWGLAALQQSMTLLTQPAEPISLSGQKKRLAIVSLAFFIGPIILALEAMNGSVTHAPQVGTFTAIIAALAIYRFITLKRSSGAPTAPAKPSQPASS